MANSAIIIQGDPTVQGWDAPFCTFGYSFSTNKLYIKLGYEATGWVALMGTSVSSDGTNQQLALSVSDGLGGQTDVAEFTKTGVTFNVPASFAPSTTEPVVAYRSAVIDLTVIQDNIPLNIPQRPGFIYILKAATLYIHDGAGTATTNLTVSVGNNATHDNEASSFISPASLNPLIGRLPAYAAISVSAAQLLDSNTPIVAKVSTVAAGVTSLNGYFSITGVWVTS